MSELLWRRTQSTPLAQALAGGNLLEARRLLKHVPVDPDALEQARLSDDPALHLLLREALGEPTPLMVSSRLEPWLHRMQTEQRAEALALQLPAQGPSSARQRF